MKNFKSVFVIDNGNLEFEQRIIVDFPCSEVQVRCVTWWDDDPENSQPITLLYSSLSGSEPLIVISSTKDHAISGRLPQTTNPGTKIKLNHQPINNTYNFKWLDFDKTDVDPAFSIFIVIELLFIGIE